MFTKRRLRDDLRSARLHDREAPGGEARRLGTFVLQPVLDHHRRGVCGERDDHLPADLPRFCRWRFSSIPLGCFSSDTVAELSGE
jgi:hypothetical protein